MATVCLRLFHLLAATCSLHIGKASGAAALLSVRNVKCAQGSKKAWERGDVLAQVSRCFSDTASIIIILFLAACATKRCGYGDENALATREEVERYS